MTAHKYRRLQANFDRQSRADLPYSVDRVGIVPRIAAAWREYWRVDPAIGVDAETQAMLILCGAVLIASPFVWFVGMCCGFWA